MTRKKKLGRKPLPKGEARTVIFQVRLTAGERKAVDGTARKAGQTATDWARGILLNSVQ